jgi:hypothetical protein
MLVLLAWLFYFMDFAFQLFFQMMNRLEDFNVKNSRIHAKKNQQKLLVSRENKKHIEGRVNGVRL